MALAHGNRSAFLLRIKKLKESIQDIDQALLITQSVTLKIKLLCRKVECLKRLGSAKFQRFLKEAKHLNKTYTGKADVKEFHRKLIKDASNDFDLHSQIIKQNCLIPNSLVFKNNKKKVNDFSSVLLDHNNKFGRFLKAKKDIEPGEIIFIEKIHHPVPSWTKHLTCCSHCLTMNWFSIPCDNCTWAMYCSEECKNVALEKYHDIECTVINVDKTLSLYESSTAIRMFIIGVKEAGNIQKLKETIENGGE